MGSSTSPGTGRLSLLGTIGVVGIALATMAGAAMFVVRARRAETNRPDLAAIRYRFAIHSVTSAADDPLAGMAALEARVAGNPTPFDLGELAEMYLKRGAASGDPRDFDKARELAERSLIALPSPNGAALIVAKIATARHQFREAIEIANGYLKTNNSISAFQILATSYLAIGELPEAAAAAETMTNERPTSGAYFTRALVEQAQGRDEEAAFDFARAAALEEPGDYPEAARLRTLWGRFVLRRGDANGAAQLFTEATRIVPDYPLAIANQAELALRTGNPADAKALFEKAFIATRIVRYLIDEARAQEVAGDRTAADATRTQVEKLVRAELARGGFGHALELVEILVDRGAPADLVEAISVGREEITRRPSADTHFQLARAYARAGRKIEARTAIQAALASGARDARIFELASRIEAMHGNPPRAQFYARQANELDPMGADGAKAWRGQGMSPR